MSGPKAVGCVWSIAALLAAAYAWRTYAHGSYGLCVCLIFPAVIFIAGLVYGWSRR